jgi:hypothetical protein
MTPALPVDDRPSTTLSEMIHYCDHPFLPIHAALFSHPDATFTLIVCGRTLEEAGRSVVISLVPEGQPFGTSIHLTLQRVRGSQPIGKATIDDHGQRYTSIHFEPVRPAFNTFFA